MGEIETHIIDCEIPLVKLDHEKEVSLYCDMVKINMMEKHLGEEYEKRNIRGFCHLVMGQEGIYAVLKSLIEDDVLISSYRCHGAGYAAGIDIKEIICENLGTSQGNCKGKGGSMHLYNDKFFGGHGIVGAQVPLAAGLAFALKYKNYQQKKKDIDLKKSKIEFLSSKSTGTSFVLYGDGASNQGQIYETFNMAKIYNLPMVLIVENNKYGMYTPIENVSVDDCFFKRGYAIPGLRVSDSDVGILYSAIAFAKNYSMTSGPIIVQVDTNRTCGHSTLDINRTYRKNECKSALELDGLARLEKKLNSKDLAEIKKSMEEEFKNILSSINSKDMPDSSNLYKDLFFPNTQ